MKTIAQRVKEHRQRAANGKRVLPIEVDFDRTADALVEDRLLAAWDDRDPGAVKDALERMIEAQCFKVLGPKDEQ